MLGMKIGILNIIYKNYSEIYSKINKGEKLYEVQSLEW